MHESSHETMRAFVRVHLAGVREQPLEILDFGSQIVDGQPLSYTDLLDDPAWNYRGLDIEAGVNVDVVVGDAYNWPEIPSDSVDLVISGQAFEHVEYFWASMFEIVRVLKPGGLVTIIAPSSGVEHRYPVDCWRFYRDGFAALARYVQCDVIDVFTDWGHGNWADSILVAQKPLWTADEVARFHERSGLQRSLLGSEQAIEDTPTAPGEPSILRSVQAGALTLELGSMRERRVTSEAEQHAAHQQRIDEEHEAAVDARIAAEAHRIAAETVDGITPLRVYGKLRGAVSTVVGEPGRQLYRRVRGRAS